MTPLYLLTTGEMSLLPIINAPVENLRYFTKSKRYEKLSVSGKSLVSIPKN